MNKNLIISGGGTGGHIYPAISIADQLKKKVEDCNILFVGAKNKMEMKKVPENGYKIIGLYISGYQRKLNFISNLTLPFKLIYSLIHSLIIILKYKPKIVVGTGGYASGPVMYIAALLRIPVFIQEQNSYPGLTNRILSKYAKKIFVAYDGMEKYFKNSEVILSGNPIRKSIKNFSGKNKKEFLNQIKLDIGCKTILVLGGSLGAKILNDFIIENLDFFKKNNLQIILQCGTRYYDNYKNFDNKFLKILPFINDMASAYSLSDLVVCRSGALTISELTACGKPSILIPFAAAGDHQLKNAKTLSKKGASIIIEEKDFDSKILLSKINDLIKDDSKLSSMSSASKKLGNKDATKIIVDLIAKGNYIV